MVPAITSVRRSARHSARRSACRLALPMAKLMEPSGALRAPCMRELAGGVCLNMAACANKRNAWADVARHADEALSLVRDEPRSGYDRAQAHMWRASARETSRRAA